MVKVVSTQGKLFDFQHLKAKAEISEHIQLHGIICLHIYCSLLFLNTGIHVSSVSPNRDLPWLFN